MRGNGDLGVYGRNADIISSHTRQIGAGPAFGRTERRFGKPTANSGISQHSESRKRS